MKRQADKQSPITMGQVHKTLKPNFDDHITGVPRDLGTWREGYQGSGIVDAFSEEERYYTGKLDVQDSSPPNHDSKSARIKTAIQELKDLFCNSFKRK